MHLVQTDRPAAPAAWRGGDGGDQVCRIAPAADNAGESFLRTGGLQALKGCHIARSD